MINAYKEGKDLYATIAKGVYHMDYWDCMEHHQDGTPNPEGKKRRASCKAILLGIMYGRGANAIAEQIGSDKQTAQGIVDNFYASFPQVKTWMDESLNELRRKEYIEDFYGRRRRLPEINLPNYEVKATENAIKKEIDFNPFINCDYRQNLDVEELVNHWKLRVQDTIKNSSNYYREKQEMTNQTYEKLKAEALKSNILLLANTGRKAQAERQCVNARIQGGAATMTKIAMNKITADEELKSYGFKMCIGVHDELIGECKEEYAEQCANRLCEIMRTSVADLINVPFKCDPAITHAWYEDEVAYSLQEKYKEMLMEGKTEEEAKEIIIRDNCEFLPEQIEHLLAFEG